MWSSPTVRKFGLVVDVTPTAIFVAQANTYMPYVANRIHDWASNSTATIIGHPYAARADEKALIMATPGFSSEMTQSSHDCVLDLADVLAYAVVEDRYVDLRT